MLGISHCLGNASALVTPILTSQLLNPLCRPLRMTRHTLATLQHREPTVQISPTTRVGAMVFAEEYVGIDLPQDPMDRTVPFVVLPDQWIACGSHLSMPQAS